MRPQRKHELISYFDNRWHYPTEVELIHFKKGDGTQFIGANCISIKAISALRYIILRFKVFDFDLPVYHNNILSDYSKYQIKLYEIF